MILDFYIYRQANEFKIYAINSNSQPAKSIDLMRLYAGPFDSMHESKEYLHKNNLIIGGSNERE